MEDGEGGGTDSGQGGVVRGAKFRLITEGKPIIVNRAVQKLYLLEVSSALKM